MQHEKFLKINKRAGWNKSVQDGKFQKINKICCMIIRETTYVKYLAFSADVEIFHSHVKHKYQEIRRIFNIKYYRLDSKL